MPEYVVTFGSQYGGQDFGADPHPVGGYDFVHRDGYWTIVAPDEDAARVLAIAVTGNRYSALYDQWQVRNTDQRGPGLNWAASFPRGELLRLVHPAMATQAVHLLEGPLPPDLAEHASNAPFLDGDEARLLVTVWGDGRGEVAYRPKDDTHVVWGPPSALAKRMG